MNFSRYSINVRSAMEDLYIGPQAEVLRTLNEINERWFHRNPDCKLGVTNKFRWKPGTYDKLKKGLMSEWLCWDKKCNGMYSLFSRERTYAKNRLKEELIRLDNTLANFRSEGQTFLSDRDEITEKFNLFRNLIDSFVEELIKIYPNISVTVENENEAFNQHKIQITIPVKEINISVAVGNREETRLLKDKIRFGGMNIHIYLHIARWFNTLYPYLKDDGTLNKRTNVQSLFNNIGMKATIYPNYLGTYHPYVSIRSNYGQNYGNVCLGNMQNDIYKSFLTFNDELFIFHLHNWMSTFKCGVTGPLNNIAYGFIGKPKEYSNSFFDVVAPRSTEQCWQDQGKFLETTGIIKQCDKSECLLRRTCTDYQKNVFVADNDAKIDKYMSKNTGWDSFIVETLEMESNNEISSEEDEDVVGFIHMLQDIMYSNQFTIDWNFVTEAYRYKKSSMFLEYFHYAAEQGWIMYIEGLSDKESDFMDGFKSIHTHDELNALYEKIWPNVPLTTEQNEMMDWVSVMRQRNR